MRFFELVLLLAVTLALSSGAKNPARQGKLFSLFNVVTFENDACTSQIASSGTGTGNREGTCLTSEECANNNGQVSGSCAAGFGVCCVFFVTSGTINQNCTFLRNAGFPSTLGDTNNIDVTVNKCSCDVCFLRLEFDTFNILGPADTVETNGGQCQDTLTLTTSSVTTFPVLCGLNSGEHVYLDMGAQCGNTASLAFAFANVADNTRTWDIKVTQVECNSRTAPPDGCFQYLTSTSGEIKTFNFDNAAQTHLQNHMYSVCIRQAEGFCCVQYFPCQDEANSFSISEDAGVGGADGAIDSQCGSDFIQISGASAACTTGTTTLTSRICGSAFTTLSVPPKFGGTLQDIPICDCSSPFDLTINTDALADGSSGVTLSRGVCLTYQQLAC